MVDDVHDALSRELGRLRDRGTLVIVEGLHDRVALERLGLTNIMTISRVPMYAVVDRVSHESECAILTDLDHEGRALYSRLNAVLPQRGIHIDNRLRNLLFRKTALKEIEGLLSFLERIKSRARHARRHQHRTDRKPYNAPAKEWETTRRWPSG